MLRQQRWAELAVLAVAAVVGNTSYGYAAYTFSTLDDPVGAAGSTFARGISGNTVVGYYTGQTDGNTHGFIESAGVYTTLDDPLATTGTFATGVLGNTVVGYYNDNTGYHGFSETGGIYTSLNYPSSLATEILGISGNTTFGAYFIYNASVPNSYAGYGFTETNGIYSTVQYPSPFVFGYTTVTGISGGTVVGNFSGYQGGAFSDTAGIFTILADPAASSNIGFSTWVAGISGDNIVGYFEDNSATDHGFVESDSIYTTLDDPLGTDGTIAYGISGSTVAGVYFDSVGDHGFIAVEGAAPEPASLGVLSVGVLGLLWRRRA